MQKDICSYIGYNSLNKIVNKMLINNFLKQYLSSKTLNLYYLKSPNKYMETIEKRIKIYSFKLYTLVVKNILINYDNFLI